MQILIPLAILFAFFWFFVLLPQRRRRSDHAHMQDDLAVGDEIITVGGLHGVVTGADETIVEIEIAPATVVRVDRRAIAARVEHEDDDEDVSEHEDDPASDPEPAAETASRADGVLSAEHSDDIAS